jgi:hypothetical protein
MSLPVEEQNAVWALTEAQLSSNAKYVWEYMADNSEVQWSTETGAADISAGMGGSLTPAEVATALTELDEKNLISSPFFIVESPSMPSGR